MEVLDEFLKKNRRGGGDPKRGKELFWALIELNTHEFQKGLNKGYNLNAGRAHSFIRQADSLKFNSRITHQQIIEKILNK